MLCEICDFFFKNSLVTNEIGQFGRNISKKKLKIENQPYHPHKLDNYIKSTYHENIASIRYLTTSPKQFIQVIKLK